MFYHAACCCGAAPNDFLILGGSSSASNQWLRVDPDDVTTLVETLALSDGHIRDVDYGPDLAAYTDGDSPVFRRSLVTPYNKAFSVGLCKVNSANKCYVTRGDTIESYNASGTLVDTKTYSGHTGIHLRIASDDDIILSMEKTATTEGFIKRLSSDMTTERWSTTWTSALDTARIDIDEDDHAYVLWDDTTSPTNNVYLEKFHENTGVSQWQTLITTGRSVSGTNPVAARNGSVYGIDSRLDPFRALTSTGAVQWTAVATYSQELAADRNGRCFAISGTNLYRLKTSDGTVDVSHSHTGESFRTLFMTFNR